MRPKFKLFAGLMLFTAVLAKGNSETDTLLIVAKNLQAQYPDSALGIFAEIAEFSGRSENFPAMAEAIKGAGVCYYFLEKYDSALTMYSRALDIRITKVKPLADSINLFSIAGLYHNMALIYSARGENEKAIVLLLKSEKIRLLTGDEAGLASLTYNSLGTLYFREGDYDQAIMYFYKILKIYVSLADRAQVASTLDQIGAVYYEQQDYGSAHRYYLKSLRIRESLNDSLAISASLNNLGLTVYAHKKPEEAELCFRKAIQIKNKYGDVYGLASVHNNIGLVFQERNFLDSALFHGKMAVQYARECGDLNKEALALVNTGAVQRLMKNFEGARKDLMLALSIAQENGYLNLNRDAVSQLANLYAETGNYTEAYRMRSLEKDLSDSLMNMESMRKIAVAETQFRYETRIARDSLQNTQLLARKEFENLENRRRQNQVVFVAIALLILLSVIVWLFFRSYRLRQRNRETQLQREAAELENTLLRSQMNPHFIFNSMNSIQSFISENDTLSAGRYLSKFATLIRHILENSARNLIPLEDELSALKLYFELEQARFRNRFSWEIFVSSELDADSVQVPPLILQPFAENAILHGILHRDSPGKIQIQIEGGAESGKLVCIILDDGVGRKRSAELRKPVPGKKMSMGLEITRERLNRLSGTSETGALEVSDITDESGSVCGTRVRVSMPYIPD